MMSCGVYAVCHFKCICHSRRKSNKNNSVGVKRVGEKKKKKKPLLESFVQESDYSVILIH